MRLADRRCVPLPEGTPALDVPTQQLLLGDLAKGWEIIDCKKLRRTLKFPDFASALDYVVQVGKMSDEQDHHPEISLTWGRVTLEIWTHTVGGLSDNDFVWAAKTDEITSKSKVLTQ
jgi:4a-hydroxytetrahydrobiopterin dehydratase